MIIEADGFFSDAIRDLNRPIAFRKSGYRPVDFVIPEGVTPDPTGVIDVGTVRMEKSPPSEIRKASGAISLQGGVDPSAAQVTLHLSRGRANTPSNGSEGVRKSDPPIEAKVDEAGVITADGLTEGEYYVTFSSPGFVQKNAVARELEAVVATLVQGYGATVEDFLLPLDRFYKALEMAASTTDDYAQKQTFLNVVYEKFFQGFAVKVLHLIRVIACAGG